MLIKFKQQEDKKARFLLGERVFYVKFFVKELEEDFLEVISSLQLRDQFLELSDNKNGIYKVSYSDPEIEETCTWSTWDLVMHKCLFWSNEIRKDSETGEKFYPITMSESENISPERRMVV